MKYLKSFKKIENEIIHVAWAGQKYMVKFPDGSVHEIETDDASIEEAHRKLFDKNHKIPSKEEVLIEAWEIYKEKNRNLSNKAIYNTISPKDEKICTRCLMREGEIMDIDPPIQIGTEIPARTHKNCRCHWKVIQAI